MHSTLVSTALPSEPNHQLNKGKAVFPLSPTATCWPLTEKPLEQGVFSKGSHLPFWCLLFGIKHFLHSAMITSLFSNLGFIYLLLMIIHLSLSSPINPAENHHRASLGSVVVDNPLVDARDFLNQFLSTLNLTKLRPQTRQIAAHKEPPEYMLELYNRFANDRTAVPSANIVRSFNNEGTSF